MPAVPADAIERFRADAERLIGTSAAGRIGLAVSGGPDSMAMLLLAHAAFAGRIAVATVDHQLRTASAAEARMVAAQCDRLGMTHETLSITPGGVRNRSARARIGRYNALERWRAHYALDWVMTAHHADDQVETVIMRLNRGSGVAGLAAIRRRQGRVVRPLLSWRRHELAKVVCQAGIETVEDPSNGDDRYDRARLRKALAEVTWLDPLAIVRSAAHLDDADVALNSVAATVLTGRLVAHHDGTWWFDASGLPAEIARRALLDCLRAVDATLAPRGATVDAALQALADGRTITVGTVLCAASGSDWQLRRAPPRRS